MKSASCYYYSVSDAWWPYGLVATLLTDIDSALHSTYLQEVLLLSTCFRPLQLQNASPDSTSQCGVELAGSLRSQGGAVGSESAFQQHSQEQCVHQGLKVLLSASLSPWLCFRVAWWGRGFLWTGRTWSHSPQF